MLLKTKNLSISDVNEEDIRGVLEVYNSNKDFLLSHMNKREVNIEWLMQEQEEMKGIDFKTLIVKENNNIIGFIDICLKEECYLSLLMVHNEYRNKGYGKEIYEALEEYLRKINLKSIRIDVVHNYNESVLRFWRNRGFKEIEKVQLQWADTLLDAVVMKKSL